MIDDLSKFVREIMENELRAQDDDRTCWMYTSQTLEGSKWRMERVVDVSSGVLTGLLSENKSLPTPKEQELEEQRLRSRVHSPHELSREASERQHDWEKLERLARLLPDALLFAREHTEGQQVRLSFKPNPGFDPPSSDSIVLRAVIGTMLIDTRYKRIVGFRAQLWNDVEFGWGLLGKLHKDGFLEVQQEQVAPGVFEIVRLNFNVTGRFLFFRSFGEQRNEVRSDFRQIPANTTIDAAAEMLKQDLRTLRQRLADATKDFGPMAF